MPVKQTIKTIQIAGVNKKCWKIGDPVVVALLGENENEGRSARCCCSCKYHKVLKSHPWVNGMSIKHTLGYVCTQDIWSDGKEAGMNVMASGPHGLCESWEQK